MKKGLYRPKQQKSFFDNYKALIAAMAFLMISLSVSAQQYDSLKARQPVNTYGSDINNLRAKYSMILPKDSTHLAVSDSGGIAYKNGGVYFWNGYRWVTIATGTTPTDYWSVTGNTGISNSNFLGAINNVPTRIRSNNIELAYFNGDDYRTVINNGAAMSNYSLAMNYGMVGIRYAVTSYTSATKKIVINGIDLTSRILVNDLLEGFEQDVLTDEFDATVSTVTFTGGNTEIVLTTDPIGGNATNMWFVDITTKYTSISRYGFGVGHLSVAQGNYSTSIGNRTWAYGNYSTALGYISNATGNYSVSIGASVNATGDYSFAMGNGTTASGLNSFSLGNTSTASGSTSATLNSNNTSSGQNSFSANYGNTASGASSFAMGEGNKSKSYGGAVIGTYNDSTNATSSTAYSSTNRAFQIGVGTADNARSNAMTVLFSGKTTLNKYGVGTFTGTPAYTLQVNSNGDIIEGAVITNPVTGTGTANTMTKFTGTSAIGNALMTDDGSVVTLASGVTTGNGFSETSSTLTTGNLMKLTSTSTVVNNGSLLSIASSGANSTASKTVNGATISVTNTGTTSTNNGLTITASGATTNNAINITAGGITATTTQTGVSGSGYANLYTVNHTVNTSAAYDGTGFVSNITTSGANSSTISAFKATQNLNSSSNMPAEVDGFNNIFNHLGGGGTLGSVKSFRTAPAIIGAGTVTNLYHYYATNVFANGGGVCTNQFGMAIDAMTTGTNNVGLNINEATGTKSVDLLIGTTTIPSGNWGIYNSSTQPNYFAGAITMADGSNKSVGVSAAMTAGTITISNTRVTASSRIFLTHATLGGVQGILSVGTITAGTSFVINSSSAADTGTVNWFIIN